MRTKLITIFLILSCNTLIAQDTLSASSGKAFNFGVSYTGDFVGNLKGGIKTGASYLGQINLSLSLDTKNAGLWKGGEFYLQVQNSHGQTPSADLVGDNQVFTNIENGNYTYLFEFRYRHTFEKLWFNLGIIDLNSEFIVSDEGLNFINSAFGVVPSVSGNVPLSIFPKNALGIMVNYAFSDAFAIQTAIIDGDPGNLDSDPYNLKQSVSKEQGVYYAGEIILSSKTGKYKLCGYYHTGSFEDVVNPSSIKKHNYGLYAIADQTLAEFSNSKKLNGFIQLGHAPTSRNYLDWYFAGGVNFYSPFLRNDDVVGIAVAHASINNDYYNSNSITTYRSETAIEFNYTLTLNNKISIQPNFQYILNPGMSRSSSNALISTLRLNLSL